MESVDIYLQPALAFKVKTYVVLRHSRPINLWISPQADAACMVGLNFLRLTCVLTLSLSKAISSDIMINRNK